MDKLKKAGMVFSGLNPETGLIKIIEIPNHDWFVGVQFHPEYRAQLKSSNILYLLLSL